MRSLVCITLLFLSSISVAQPFVEDIRAFERRDSVQFPPKNAILFVGSSSIVMWKTLTDDFPGHAVVNRGFGGSTLEDVIRYADRIVYPYQAKQIVIYCGENDIASGVNPQEVFRRFQTLFRGIRSNSPKAHVTFISMKPSPSRDQFRNQIIEGNRLIREYLASQRRTSYVDVFLPMLDANGEPREELFLKDRLHMNASGYAIWKKAVAPKLR